MKLKITDNLGLKLLALFTAVILWLAVVNINDSVESVRYSLGVELRNTNVITDSGKVFRVEDGTDNVLVTVRARRSVLEKLEPSDFKLVADMEKDLKYDSLVGITVECKNKHITPEEQVSLSRSNVKVSIEDSATEHFPVTVRSVGSPNAGLKIGSMEPERTIVKIKGPVSIIERIKRVEAEVDVTGLPSTAVKHCTLKILDGNGEEMDTTYLSYAGKRDGISVTVNMLNTKTLPFELTYTGTPAEGYRVAGITCKPDVVTVAGNSGMLAGLTALSIPAEALNVEGMNADLQKVIDLNSYLPSGVILSDENDASVLVTVSIEYAGTAEEVQPEEEGGETQAPSADDGLAGDGTGGNTGSANDKKDPDAAGSTTNQKPSAGNADDKEQTEESSRKPEKSEKPKGSFE